MAAWLLRAVKDIDIRAYLPHVSAPVLLIHDGNPVINVDGMRWLAEQLPDARLRLVTGRSPMAPFLPEQATLDEVEEFLEGTRSGGKTDRAVYTLLFTDLAGSTEQLTRVGDDHWQHVLDAHRAAVRQALARHSGHEMNTAGDGFLAKSALPSEALRCAHEIQEDAAAQDLHIRIGLHAGEIVTQASDVLGVAVHIAAGSLPKRGPVRFSSQRPSLLSHSAPERSSNLRPNTNSKESLRHGAYIA
jgi:hypothetical protein